MKPYPSWFKAGCLVKFHGFGPAVKVLEIDDGKQLWLAEDLAGRNYYTFDEIEKFWKPEDQWMSDEDFEKMVNQTDSTRGETPGP
jgi:hypothetical protein